MNNMSNEQILKKGIKDSFTIKFNEGEQPQAIVERLSNQFYKFITKEPGFTRAHISRGMRDIVTEENRGEVITALFNIYFNRISHASQISNEIDNYVKDIIGSSGDINKLVSIILHNKEMTYRVR